MMVKGVFVRKDWAAEEGLNLDRQGLDLRRIL